MAAQGSGDVGDRTASVVTVSDRVSAGQAEDRSGPTAVALLESSGIRVVECRVIPDGVESVSETLSEIAGSVDLIVTTGGTGLTGCLPSKTGLGSPPMLFASAGSFRSRCEPSATAQPMSPRTGRQSPVQARVRPP